MLSNFELWAPVRLHRWRRSRLPALQLQRVALRYPLSRRPLPPVVRQVVEHMPFKGRQITPNNMIVKVVLPVER